GRRVSSRRDTSRGDSGGSMSKPKSKAKVAPIDQVLARPGLSPAAIKRLHQQIFNLSVERTKGR
ncbi:MAG: hypothetical protein ACOYMH_13150, partial [Zwartia sp.]